MIPCALFVKVKVKVQLRFSAPSAGIAENRADLIESATPCHDVQVVGLYQDSNPRRLIVLAAMSEDYTTALQHLLLNLSMAVLCLIDFCIALHDCSNARFGHEVTCRYSYVWFHALIVMFKPNSINCFVLSRNPTSML